MNHPREFPPLSTPTCLPWRHPGFMSQLGSPWVAEVPSTPLPHPVWVARSESLAESLGVSSWLASEEALAVLSGSGLGSGQPASLATAYSGHQFGVWAGALGDGRALLLGEIDTPTGVQELQLKGSGPTPFSRMGDGRAVLRSSIREFLCSEAMAALGIPTTRALAVIGSPSPVRRETLETAAVVTRIAPSFLRFGHFEHGCHTLGDLSVLRRLVDAVIHHYFSALTNEHTAGDEGYGLWLEEVARRTARLMSQWQAVGFCHGVMNTDNMSILGLTLDYGPFGFMDAFDPGHICNHSDHQGRYAYARQPQIAFWNLHALASAVSPIFEDTSRALAAIEVYKTEFHRCWALQLKAKLGLDRPASIDEDLSRDWLKLLAQQRADFTLAFRALSGVQRDQESLPSALSDLFVDREALKVWVDRYRARLKEEHDTDEVRALRMNRTNPKFVLRNHLAEIAIQSARDGDFSEVRRLSNVLSHPFDDQPEAAAYAAVPPSWAQELEISCSS